MVAVVVATGLSVAGMLIVHKRVDAATLITYHEVSGYLLSVVGTLYVLLDFIIVEAQHRI